MQRLGLTPGLDGKRVIVQGLGNVGYHAAKFCHEGGRDHRRHRRARRRHRQPARARPDAVVAHRRARGLDPRLPRRARHHADGGEALELDCDVLVPAALENVLTGENAPRIKAQIVLEGANGPTTPEAEAIFRERGLLVIPDVYANAGGVTVSYFEWLKNLSARAVRPAREAARGDATRRASCARSNRSPARRSPTTSGAMLDSRIRRAGHRQLRPGGNDGRQAYHAIREVLKQHPDLGDLRAAAFRIAIDKIARVVHGPGRLSVEAAEATVPALVCYLSPGGA